MRFRLVDWEPPAEAEPPQLEAGGAAASASDPEQEAED
jgi:hypothetical protein